MPRIAPADLTGPQARTLLGRVLGRRPEVLDAFGRLSTELRFRGLLPVELKEAVRRATAADVGCEYCASLGEYRPTPDDKRESLAVAFARMVAEDHHSITDAHLDMLREEFTEDEIVELVALICLVTVAGQMFGAVMGIESAPEHEIEMHAATLERAAARG